MYAGGVDEIRRKGQMDSRVVIPAYNIDGQVSFCKPGQKASEELYGFLGGRAFVVDVPGDQNGIRDLVICYSKDFLQDMFLVGQQG